VVFVDTNIFIYAQDETDPVKTKKARELLVSLVSSKRGRVSTQVIQEFCNVMVKRSAAPLRTADARRIVRELLAPMSGHQPDVQFYLRSLELFEQHSLSFYDALIVQAAIDLNCETLYSEDMQHGQKFGNLTIINPFL